jgi:hypothetical protein
MSDEKSLLDEVKPATLFTPTLRFPIRVDGYDVSDPDPLKHSILGTNWLNSEKVTILLRPSTSPDRKNIADFHSDPASEAPVTTPVGGIMVVEGAYKDKKLSRDNDRKVYNAIWLVRIADSVNKGFPISSIRTLARVHEPRLKDVNDLSKGYKQSITLMNTDYVFPLTPDDDLETLVLDMLDPMIKRNDQTNPTGWTRSKFPEPIKRAGLLVAGVRLRDNNTGGSKLSEFYGGFYKPAGSDMSIPKSRNMIADNLRSDPAWAQTKNLIDRAMADPNGRYVVETIPMSNVQVAKNTAQRSAKEAGRGRTVSTKIGVADKEGNITHSANGFTPAACCIILSANCIPLVTYAKPLSTLPFATLTGVANPSELLQHAQIRNEASERYNKKLPSQLNKPTPVTASPANKNQPDQTAPVVTEKMHALLTSVSVENIGNNMLLAQLPTAAMATEYAKEIGSNSAGTKLFFPMSSLPAFTEATARDALTLDIQATMAVVTEHEAAPVISDSEKNPETTLLVSQEKQRPNAASLDDAFNEINPPPVHEPLDLSTLNFDDIDLDGVLGEQYGSPSHIQ